MGFEFRYDRPSTLEWLASDLGGWMKSKREADIANDFMRAQQRQNQVNAGVGALGNLGASYFDAIKEQELRRQKEANDMLDRQSATQLLFDKMQMSEDLKRITDPRAKSELVGLKGNYWSATNDPRNYRDGQLTESGAAIIQGIQQKYAAKLQEAMPPPPPQPSDPDYDAKVLQAFGGVRLNTGEILVPKGVQVVRPDKAGREASPEETTFKEVETEWKRLQSEEDARAKAASTTPRQIGFPEAQQSLETRKAEFQSIKDAGGMSAYMEQLRPQQALSEFTSEAAFFNDLMQPGFIRKTFGGMMPGGESSDERGHKSIDPETAAAHARKLEQLSPQLAPAERQQADKMLSFYRRMMGQPQGATIAPDAAQPETPLSPELAADQQKLIQIRQSQKSDDPRQWTPEARAEAKTIADRLSGAMLEKIRSSGRPATAEERKLLLQYRELVADGTSP